MFFLRPQLPYLSCSNLLNCWLYRFPFQNPWKRIILIKKHLSLLLRTIWQLMSQVLLDILSER